MRYQSTHALNKWNLVFYTFLLFSSTLDVIRVSVPEVANSRKPIETQSLHCPWHNGPIVPLLDTKDVFARIMWNPIL